MNVNGEVELKAKFLSPVTPDDLMRSSLPYSYLEVEVRSTDGKTHDVQLYTDISAGKASALTCESTANVFGKNGYPETADRPPSGRTVLWKTMLALAAILLFQNFSCRLQTLPRD